MKNITIDAGQNTVQKEDAKPIKVPKECRGIGEEANAVIVVALNSRGIAGKAILQPEIIKSMDRHACTIMKDQLERFFNAILSEL